MTSSTLSGFENAIRAVVDPVALPSIAYGILRKGEIVLLGAAGWADKEGIAATPQTLYALASVTKPMTATAVAMLVEKGIVDLDAPIERYLGGLTLDGKAGDSSGASVRRVLNHSAGLPLHYRFYYADVLPKRRPFEDVVAKFGKLISPPCERHLYSNLGYGLLDRLIETVSGTDYASFMRSKVFEPLDLRHSSIGPVAGVAVGYGQDGSAYPPYATDHPGGSAAFASIEDLLAFGQLHLGGDHDLLSPETRKAMRVPTFGYGLGWGVTQRSGLEMHGHSGSMGGVSAVLRLVPSLDLVVAFVANGEGAVPSTLADDAISLFDANYGDCIEAERISAKKGPLVCALPEGIWSGAIEIPGDRLPFALEIGPYEVLARLDGVESFLKDPSFTGGYLRGAFEGDLAVPHEIDAPYRLHLDLELQGYSLCGAVAAVSQPLSERVGDALSFWTDLEA